MKRVIQSSIAGACMAFLALPVFAGGAADDISVSDARVRAVAEGQKNTAAFMVLSNSGSSDHAVVSADSPVANIVELHTHINEDGMMRMRQIEKIEIAAGSETTLKPGGLHVMLMDLKQQINDGDSVMVTLQFEDGSKMEINAPAKKMKMMMKHKHQHKHGDSSSN